VEKWKAELEALLGAEDYSGLIRVSQGALARTIRYLGGHLYSGDESLRWRSVRALGALAADATLVSEKKLTEQLRRYFWSLNDESGAVPFGVPEAIGEILARRPSLHDAFLPLLCSMLTEEEVSQTGPIERGVIWGIGRVGAAAAHCAPEVVSRIRDLAASHPDTATRQIAAWALRRITGAGE